MGHAARYVGCDPWEARWWQVNLDTIALLAASSWVIYILASVVATL